MTDKSCCLEGTTLTLASTLVHIGNSSVTTTTATATVTSKASGPSIVAVGVGVGAPLAVFAFVMLGVGFLWGKKKAQANYRTIGVSYNSGNHASDGDHMSMGLRHGDQERYMKSMGKDLPVSFLEAKNQYPGESLPFDKSSCLRARQNKPTTQKFRSFYFFCYHTRQMI